MLRVAILAMILVVSAGCTQRQSQDQYQELLTSANTARRAALGDAARDSSAHDLRAAATRVATIAQQLEDLNPPSNVQQAHTRYVESLQGLRDVLNRLADCADMQVEDASQALECRATINHRALEEIDNDFDEADAIFTHAGYTMASGAASTDTKDS